MSIANPFTEVSDVVDFFGEKHPYVKMFVKTGWAPDFIIQHFTLDDELLTPTEYGEKEYPEEILKAEDWPSENEFLQNHYGIGEKDVERVQCCL